MGMVYEPERQPDRGPKASPGRRPAVLGAAALALAAIFVLGRFAAPTTTTTPDDEHTAFLDLPTSTSTTLFPEQGGHFRWGLVVRLDDQPLAVHRLEGHLLVFGRGPSSRGMVLWRASPQFGTNPDGLPVIGTDHMIDGVVEQGGGLLALGSEVATGSPVAWTSHDGINWEKTLLPHDGLEGMRPLFYAALSVGDLTIARAEAGQSIDSEALWDRAESAMRSRFGELMNSFYVSGVGRDITFTALGPLDLDLGSAPVAELGLDPGDYLPHSVSGRPMAWVSRDGETWEPTPGKSPGQWGEMFEGPDGRIWSTDPTSEPPGLIATDDGVRWVRMPSTGSVSAIRSWEGRLIALSRPLTLVTSSDGANWRELDGPDGLLGSPSGGRIVLGHHFDAGPSGVVVIVSRHSTSGSPGTETTPAEVIVKREGAFELWATWDGHLILRRMGLTVTHVRSWDPRPDQISFDLAAGTVTLKVPSTGEAAITVTAEDLMRVEPAIRREPWDPGDVRRALLFTPDGSKWTVEGLGRFDHAQVYWLRLFEDALVLVTHGQDGYSVYASPLP
jgi:hypothetical protein